MKCETQNCNNKVPEKNIGRICAYMIEDNVCVPNYTNVPDCNCCDSCRNICHEGKLKQEEDE